jgi:hypothetical protein
MVRIYSFNSLSDVKVEWVNQQSWSVDEHIAIDLHMRKELLPLWMHSFPEVGMWPPKRWEIESGHIRISSWVQGERRRRRRIHSESKQQKVLTMSLTDENPEYIWRGYRFPMGQGWVMRRLHLYAYMCMWGFITGAIIAFINSDKETRESINEGRMSSTSGGCSQRLSNSSNNSSILFYQHHNYFFFN